MTHLHLTIVVEVYNGTRTKQATNQLLKNAKFWSNENHWEWATKPNPREKASFLSENILPMQESGQLNFIKRPKVIFWRNQN
jgi:hypothetical protein